MNEVLGLRNQELYTMVDIVGRCEDVICETYDYVCYMSQYKKWKYDILGVVGKSALTYIGDLSTDGKGVIMGADCIDNAKVLIIDDTCYKGTTYAKVIALLKEMGADDIDVYVSQLSKEGRGVDGIVKTGVRNVFTLTGKGKVVNETLTSNGKNVPLYQLLVDNIAD